MRRFLSYVERAGNALPHPALLFLGLGLLVILASALTSLLGLTAIHPVSGELLKPVNLLSRDGIYRILQESVTNFTAFPPLGVVLVAMLGLGIAEQSGLLATLLQRFVAKAPPHLLSFSVVFAGVMSSLAVDAGYVVLIPLAALAFKAAGRNPVVGIAAGFAGVSGGFGANLLLTPTDAVLAGLSTSAAQLLDPSYEVNPAGNYYFVTVSTFLISTVGALVTDWILEPDYRETQSDLRVATSHESLKGVSIFSLVFVAVVLFGMFWHDGPLLQSPFIQGGVVLISLYAAGAGVLYGYANGHFGGDNGAVRAMEKTLAGMGSYLVLMFFAAQFIAWFNWSQLGLIGAIKGSELLRGLDIGSTPLLLVFVGLAAFVNLFVGSASAKWALMAPVFVPLFMLLGVDPEATQLAYRIGDSSTNIIAPLMPYLPVVLTFLTRYDEEAGMGTLVALMLPYSISLLISWSALLALWLGIGLPLGV